MSIDVCLSESAIKCVIWDLDHTLWDGILLEDKDVSLREGILNIIIELDKRGILQSVASKNNSESAKERLTEMGVWDFFLYPEIHFGHKSESIKKIAQSLNISQDSIAFVDDQPYELEEVKFNLPEVYIINAEQIDLLLNLPRLNPRFITQDSKRRRQMYLEDKKRNELEEIFEGPNSQFLSSLNMKLVFSRLTEEDLKRAEELTVRTHQLNSTGYTYSYEELLSLNQSPQHQLWIAELTDKFGDYGKIGLCLMDCTKEGIWTIKLLLMSCRVMSRGVGSVMITFLKMLAIENDVILRAEFIHTERNRMMYITYKFSGFEEIQENGNEIIFESQENEDSIYPDYITVIVLPELQ